MPGNEDEAASPLDAYLDRADSQARIPQVPGMSGHEDAGFTLRVYRHGMRR